MARIKNPTGVHKMDLCVLHFIWWWKVATTSAVGGRFSRDFGWHPTTTHWRLSKLMRLGLLTREYSSIAYGQVWTLTSKGFKIIEPDLPRVIQKASPLKNAQRELLVQAAHLGEWLPRGSAPDVEFFTSQEINSFDPEDYPGWVPTTNRHRPDGYWNISSANQKRTVALELDIHPRSSDECRDAVNFYHTERKVDSVIWIVGTQTTLHRVVDASRSSPFPGRDLFNFIELVDFKNHGWDAKIIAGTNTGMKMVEFLNQFRSSKDQENAEQFPRACWIREILNTRLRPMVSMTSSNAENA